MIAIDVVGELDEVCLEMLRETISRAARSTASIVLNVDGLDVTWPETLAAFSELMRRVRQSGFDCAIDARQRRIRTLLVRAGCGDALFAAGAPAAAERRVIIARHLSEKRRSKRAAR